MPPDTRLAQALHEGVAQRLTGVAAALRSVAELADEDRARCSKELDAAIAELRAIMEDRAAAAGGGGASELEQLIRDFVVEGIRNAEKHSHPRVIAFSGSVSPDRIQVEVLNDGVEPSGGGNGTHLGLWMLGETAARLGGSIDAHRLGGDGWRTALTIPRRGV
ncbi:MAG TPA: hypothetical protein VF712_06980 [Thermoleophilaceae bacterium]